MNPRIPFSLVSSTDHSPAARAQRLAAELRAIGDEQTHDLVTAFDDAIRLAEEAADNFIISVGVREVARRVALRLREDVMVARSIMGRAS
jgi:hypothetical protein